MNEIDFNARTGRIVLLVAVLATGMAFVEATAIVLAIPAIQESYSASTAELLWVNTAYAIPLSALLLVGGLLGDRFGRRRIFMTGIVIFTVAAFGCGFAPNIDALILFRAIQGVGAALMVPGSLSIIAEHFPASSRGRAIGTWSGLSVVTTLAGPVLGGCLAGAGLWRWIFFLNLPVAVVILLLSWWKLAGTCRKSPAADLPKIDWFGTCLLSFFLTAFSYSLLEASGQGIGGRVVLAVIFGTVAGVSFFRREARSENPLIPRTLFRSKALRSVAASTLLLYTALNGLLFFLPLNLISVRGCSAALAGLAPLPLMLPLAILSRLAGQLADRHGYPLPLLIGSFTAGAGFLLLALPGLSKDTSATWMPFLPGLLVLGIGIGFCVAPLSSAVISLMPRNDIGLASAFNSFLSRFSSLVAVAVLGPLVLAAFQIALPPVEFPDAGQIATSLAVSLSDLRESAKSGEGMSPSAGGQTPGIREAFVGAFRFLCIFSTLLCWSSSVAAFKESKRNAKALAANQLEQAIT
jgi:EmrB/QacA subfamily drug resistance transporter